MDTKRKDASTLNGRKIGYVELSNGSNPMFRFMSKRGQLIFSVPIYQLFDEEGFRMGYDETPVQERR